MGLINFIILSNAQHSGSLQPPGEPGFTGTYYVSASGTSNGFTASTSMSADSFESQTLTDNVTVLINAGDTV